MLLLLLKKRKLQVGVGEGISILQVWLMVVQLVCEIDVIKAYE
jgi:hypothetical protein